MDSLDGGRHVDSLGAAAVEQACAEVRDKVLKKLGPHLGDVDLAEDAVQDALVAALKSWPRDGVPDSPEAWLLVTARRKALDRLRRSKMHRDRVRELAAASGLDRVSHWEESDLAAVGDDHLRLIFTSCHPALSEASRVALTLRTVCGLTTGEIAQALLVSEPTMAQRIARAKRKIRENRIPYRVPRPAELPDRLHAVLTTVYLIFNEGYSGRGDETVRVDLCREALRLGRRLANLFPREAEVHGLVALMSFLRSRESARTDQHGAYVPLEEQDRALWDADLVRDGVAALRRARATGLPGPFQVQAAIAAVHSDVAGTGSTDWALVAAMYQVLYELQPSPVVEVNRAVAVGRAGDPHAGLAALEPFLIDPEMERYQPLYAALAELLTQLGDRSALAAYDRAIELSGSAAQAAELERRRARFGERVVTS
jgi:RNA polymerase sigma-70 factor (ECF subfamily)